MSRPRSKSSAPFSLRLASLVVAAALAAIPLTSGIALQHIETAARLAPQLEVVVIESTRSDAVDVLQTASGIITGVSYEGGNATLMVGDLMFPMGDVRSIRLPEE